MAGERGAVLNAAPSPRLTLANATVPLALMGDVSSGALGRFDIAIAEGRIAAIELAGARPPEGPVHDMDAGLMLPAFVDVHTHLDKGHIWPRAQNPDGTFMGALDATAIDREARWLPEDVEARMEFALRCAYAHGTAAIRTHIDSAPPQGEISWDVFDKVRERWRGRIELQAVALFGPDVMLDKPTLLGIARRAARSGGRLGGAIAVYPEAARAVRNVVDVAGEFGLDIDLHCDETLDPDSQVLRHLAGAVLVTGYKGKVVAGHCCALAAQAPEIVAETIARTAEAGIAVVSLPLCNLYLQDRQMPATPRRRGVTLVNELQAAGIAVALASDNTRDPFYAYGDLDPLEVLREGARIAHLDHPMDKAFDWARAVTATPAAIAEFTHKGQIAVGQPADLVLLRARSWTELNARPQADRVVLRAGRQVEARLPDYRELDDLME